MYAKLNGEDKKVGFFTRSENLALLMHDTLLEAEYEELVDAFVLATEEGHEVGVLSQSVSKKLEELEEFYVLFEDRLIPVAGG